MVCVVLAGGSGDRLWPLSRKNYPKQFITYKNKMSSFQETITRNIPFCEEFIVISNVRYESVVTGQMKQFQGIKFRLILEKESMGTAGAIALLTECIPSCEMIMVVPSDLVFGQENYADVIYRAKQLAEEKRLCLFGAVPQNAGVEYGYIQCSGNEVTGFIEKPSREKAQELFGMDKTLWNCGVLVTQVGVLREEMEKHAFCITEKVHKAFSDAGKSKEDNLLITVDSDFTRAGFEQAVLEKSERLAVVRVCCSWHNLNDFNSYCEVEETSSENVIFEDCENTTVINQAEGTLVVANSLKNTLIVNTADAVYITDKNDVNRIKKIVDEHAQERGNFFEESPLVYRPWGTRQLIQMSAGYRVRKIVVYPGMRLSAHLHQNRNENYIVVSGKLSIKLDKRNVLLYPGDSFNVLPGIRHQLYNDTDDIVIAIEVDTGKIIDEKDMVREVSKESADNFNFPNIFKLQPAYKDYLWGGNTLKTLFGKNSPYEVTAESWELSAHPDGASCIDGGMLDGMSFERFIREYGDRVCGWKSRTFDRFPILVKFIDAKNALSIQIHPNDEYAFINDNEFGKNEMWYVMDCKPGAFLYCGLKKELTKEELRERIENLTLTDVLNKVEVKPGDVVFVPAGTVHAIGEGILICEIQQNSNSTYRMYDYGRRDKNGRLRELHIDKALDVVNTEPYIPNVNGVGEPVVHEHSMQQLLSRCKYFEVFKYVIFDSEIIQVDDASFRSVIVLKGHCRIWCGTEVHEAKAGESFFVSAGRKRLHVEGKCELIVTNI